MGIGFSYIFVDAFVQSGAWNAIIAGINKAIGTIAAAAVHVSGIILMNLNVSYKITRWSLLKNSSYLWHFEAKLDLVFSYALFLLCYVCILFIGPIILKHADFRYSVGEEND